jgi:hypothetical protein
MQPATLIAVITGMSLLLSASPGLAQPQTLSDTASGPFEAASNWGDSHNIGTQAAPVVEILAPSEARRPDFARDELGDEWDMHNSQDVDYMDHVKNSSFGPGGWYGEVTQGDVANIALFAPGGPGNPAGVTSIDTSKYYYFSYDLYVPSGNPGDATNHRVIYLTQWSWSGLIPGTQNCSGALTYPSYDTWHTYEYDMRSMPLDGSACGSWNWSGHNVAALAVWPHEQWNSVNSGRGPEFFQYRNISLKGDNQADISYNIRWCVADADGDVITTSLYYDTDTVWDSDEVMIASVVTQPVSPGPHKIYLPLIHGPSSSNDLACSTPGAKQERFTWATSGLPDGNTYFVWFEVTDGSTTIREVSTTTAPIFIDH